MTFPAFQPVLRLSRLLAGAVASFVLVQGASSLRAQDPEPTPVINYNPALTQVQGQLPINFPVYPVTITAPGVTGLLFPLVATFRVSSTTRPAGVSVGAVADFVKIYASPTDVVPISGISFTGAGLSNSRTVYVKVDYPATAAAGTYAFKLFAEHPAWPGAGVRNEGSEINGSVTAPPNPPPIGPVVTIGTPFDGQIFEVPPGTTFPHPIPLTFTAVGQGDNPRPVMTVSADVDGSPVTIPSQAIANLGTTSVSVGSGTTVVNMMVSGVGQHVVTAHGTNDVNLSASDVHVFTVRLQATPQVTITTPANGTSFNLPYGAASVAVPLTFTGTTPANTNTTIRTLEARLFLNDGPTSTAITLAPSELTGIGQISATGTTTLAIPSVGTHRIWARTTNEYGEATTSNTFIVVRTKATLTVTADNKTKVYGTANPTLTSVITGFVNGDTLATSDVTGAAAHSTTAVQFSPVLASGSYPITPALGTLASNNYDFVFVNGGLTITKAQLTVTPDAITKPYGVAVPTLTYAISAPLAGDPNTPAYSGVPTISTTATQASAPQAGGYPITSAVGTLTSNNYNFVFATNVLTVTKVNLTFTALNASKVYGAALPNFGRTVSGFVNGDTEATAFTGNPAITTTATTTSTVAGSTYPITIAAGTLASTKYNFLFVPAQLTVTRAPLVVTAANKTKVQGTANPALTYTITGFVLNETSTVLSAQPSISTTAVTSSPVGSYPITVTGGTAANYTFSYVNAALTVTAASGPTVCMTMEFDGSTAASGTAGNIRTYTMNGVSVKVSAFSRVRPSPGGALVPAYLGVFPGGLGVTDTGEGDGSGNLHTVDNIGRDNFVLFEFSQPVKVNRAFLGYVINDSDLTVWMGNANNPYTNHLTLSDSILNGMTREDNDATHGDTRWADFNAGELSGNVLVIAGSLSDTSPDDEFKIGALSFCTVSEATPPPAALKACGVVYFDVSRNGTRNTDEPGFGGITVKLYKGGALVASTVTAADGSYCFNVASGNYEIDVIEIPGLTPTNCDERSFSVTSSNVTISDVGLGFNFCTLQSLNAGGYSHGYWKNNLSKAIANQTSGTQETKANLTAWTNTISSLQLSTFQGMTMSTAVSTMSGSDQLKLQLLASEYNYVSGRLINNSQPLTWAFIYWGEVVVKNATSYSSSYRTFVKDWMDAFNNSHGGQLDGPTSY